MSGFKTADYAATFSGKQINLDLVGPGDIELVDIAVGLSNQCRYAGQVWPFYSVAEHSVLVAMLMPADQPELRLKALLHDAAEYILNDMIRPVKRRVEGYGMMEDAVHKAVEEKFGLSYTEQDWLAIKRADDLITIAERRILMPRVDRESYGRGVNEEDIPSVAFKCHPPAEAAVQFLSSYFFLSSKEPDDRQLDLISILTETLNS